jgi:hypothetical protein
MNMRTNLTQHKCKGKCPEFKGEQCNHCLVSQDEMGELQMGNTTEVARTLEEWGDDRHIENHISAHCQVHNLVQGGDV